MKQYILGLYLLGLTAIAPNTFADESRSLDILMTIDKSESMAEHSGKMANALRVHLDALSTKFDWVIKVNSTTFECVGNDNTLNREYYLANREEVLQSLDRLVDGSSDGFNVERGIRSMTLGLLGVCSDGQKPWRRPKAKTTVIIISDEKNCGSGMNQACKYSSDRFAFYFESYKFVDTRVYGLLHTQDVDGCTSGGYEYEPFPKEYVGIIERSGGFYQEVCQASYYNFLEKVLESDEARFDQ